MICSHAPCHRATAPSLSFSVYSCPCPLKRRRTNLANRHDSSIRPAFIMYRQHYHVVQSRRDFSPVQAMGPYPSPTPSSSAFNKTTSPRAPDGTAAALDEHSGLFGHTEPMVTRDIPYHMVQGLVAPDRHSYTYSVNSYSPSEPRVASTWDDFAYLRVEEMRLAAARLPVSGDADDGTLSRPFEHHGMHNVTDSPTDVAEQERDYCITDARRPRPSAPCPHNDMLSAISLHPMSTPPELKSRKKPPLSGTLQSEMEYNTKASSSSDEDARPPARKSRQENGKDGDKAVYRCEHCFRTFTRDTDRKRHFKSVSADNMTMFATTMTDAQGQRFTLKGRHIRAIIVQKYSKEGILRPGKAFQFPITFNVAEGIKQTRT